MEYLVFDTQEDAFCANAVISLNMRLSGDVTVQWSTEKQRVDGKFVIPYPEERYMTHVSRYLDVQEYQDNWFPTQEEG